MGSLCALSSSLLDIVNHGVVCAPFLSQANLKT